MEPCQSHSDMAVKIAEACTQVDSHEKRLDTYAENIQRIHQRIDEMNDKLDGMKELVNEKIMMYSKSMHDQIQSMFTLIADPKEGLGRGLADRIARLEELARWTYKIGGWAMAAMIGLSYLFRDNFSRFIKWYFSL